jgi:hypothetical protein
VRVSLKSDKNNLYFTWRPIHIFIISRSVLLRVRNVSDKIVEKIKRHILCAVTFWHVYVLAGAYFVWPWAPYRTIRDVTPEPLSDTDTYILTCDMYKSSLRHIHDPVLSSLKMKGIGLLFFLNRPDYKMWKNIVEPGRPHIACALHAGYLRLHPHSQYVILMAFPLQQWLHECASVLRCTYIACLVYHISLSYS